MDVHIAIIAEKMMHEGISQVFTTDAVRVGLDYEGVYDLMVLWNEETDVNEKNEIVADIQDMIKECGKKKEKK